MGRYRQGIPGTLARYGGRLAVRGVVEDVLEGEIRPDSVVAFEFDSEDDARRWYTSPEYATLRQHRLNSAESTLLLLTSPPGPADLQTSKLETGHEIERP